MQNNILTFIPKIYLPQSIFFGSRSMIFFKTIQDKKKLFIISKSFQEKNKEFINSILINNSKSFNQSGEPTIQDFNKLKNYCQKNKFDYLVAIGGGSVIDLVKLVKRDLKTKMIAVPTTIGSGAEVSQHALLINKQSKQVFSSPDLLPEIVIINPDYLKSLFKKQIIVQSIDALSHALEALVSKMSNIFSDSLALRAIDNIYFNLNNKKLNLEELQISALLAGLAQSSAATGLAHSFAHYFGAQQNINHSQAVSIFLLDVLKLNIKHTDKYQKLDQLKNLSAKNFISRLSKLIKPGKIKINNNLKDIANAIKKDICTLTNPYSPTTEDVIKILKKYA